MFSGVIADLTVKSAAGAALGAALDPFSVSLLAGYRSDRFGYAFAAGYQAALKALARATELERSGRGDESFGKGSPVALQATLRHDWLKFGALCSTEGRRPPTRDSIKTTAVPVPAADSGDDDDIDSRAVRPA